jgi:hypothetical protein
MKEVHALIVKSFLLFEEVDKAVKVPEVVKPLLQEFLEVISDDHMSYLLYVISNTRLT